MSGQHYSLRWNNHQSHVLSAFDALLQTESLVDCTLVCEDTNVKAHKVVLSACSPYFQKIFTENPGKHPIIVLKDVKGWEVQCIVDFMYKGETSVPESQLNGLIKAAENLKVRGLTSSDQQLPAGLTLETSSTAGSPHNGFHSGRNSRYAAYEHRPPPSHSSQSSPISLAHHPEDMRARSPSGNHGPPGSGPRRKQARPRRRSGDSIGGSSLDLSKGESPPHKSPTLNGNGSMDVDHSGPENLSLKRPSSSPAINLVKMETLLDHDTRPTSSSDLDRSKTSPTSSTPGLPLNAAAEHLRAAFHSPMDKAAQFAALAAAAHSNGLHHAMGEHEARVEALQALNFMAAGGGLPPFPHPGLALGPPMSSSGNTATTSQHSAAAAASAAGHNRPTSTGPGTPNSAFSDNPSLKSGFEFQRISIDRSKMSEEEAFEHAIEMIQTRQMGFRKAADFFSVSKWKLYKTARKRGIYAEIKKQNQAQQALSKVPTNVQHFADMGVYKQLKKKTHLAKDPIFPHLPNGEADMRKTFKPTPTTVNNVTIVNNSSNNNNNTNNNNSNNNNNNNSSVTPNKNFPKMTDLNAKIFPKIEDEVLTNQKQPEMVVPMSEETEVDDVEEEEERVLVINHINENDGSHDDDDSGREDSA